MANVTIIGAGLSGLTAARALLGHGHDVVVYDKGRGVGGRLATRRMDGARLDHGAQFFTVRGDEFRATVSEAQTAGAVVEWCRGFGPEPDGYARYRGSDGMTSFAKWLATGVDVRLDERIGDVRSVGADAFIVTAPIPQALDLLVTSAMAPPRELASRLAEVRYNRTIAGLFVLDEPTGISPPGALQQPDDPTLTFITDNMVKGISSVPAVTVHASDAWSRAHWDVDLEEMEGDLLAEAIPYMGQGTAFNFMAHKWLYAGPQNPWPDRFCVTTEEPLVLLAGDSFGGPKVEGAFNSGLAAGRELIRRFS